MGRVVCVNREGFVGVVCRARGDGLCRWARRGGMTWVLGLVVGWDG